jgi:hypothetical protein
MAIDYFDLLKQGGEWLGAARRWLQWNTHNGDRVTWGSEEVLHPPLTVRQVEELAAHVAAATLNEYRIRNAEFAIAQLRHLYQQLHDDTIKDQKRVAKYLLGPAIEQLEKVLTPKK